MLYHTRLLSILFVAVLWTTLGHAQNRISPADAKDHVGENATVCGDVASTHYAARTRGNPTFINLDRAYPNQIFTALIWGSDRPKFGSPEETYRGKHICVTGTISAYRGVPEVIVREPSQIRVP
jgi:hypothetical protein